MRLFVNSVWACCIEVLATAGQPGAGNKDGLLGFAILVGSLASALAPGLRVSAVTGAMCGQRMRMGATGLLVTYWAMRQRAVLGLWRL